MKKQLLTLLSCAALAVQGQVTMQGNVPPMGTQYKLNSITSTFTPLAAGADQTWDLSTATTTAMYTYTVVDPATLPSKIKDSVPNAGWGVRLEMGAPTPDLAPYDFFKNETTHWIKVGSKGSGSGAVEKKNDTSFYFDQSYQTTKYYGYMYRTYAGYGSLKFKSSTFNNVVMMKMTFIGTTDTAVQIVQFSPYHLVLLSYVLQGANMNNKYFWEPIVSTGISEEKDQFNFLLYPNPASQNVSVVLPDHFTGSLELKDMTGKTVYRNVAPEKVQTIDVSQFEKGIYLLHAIQGSHQAVQKLVVN